MYYPGKLLILITMLGSWFTGNAQNCELPVVTYFSNPTINGFDIEWIDFNSNPNYFEIEIGKRGFERRFRPDYSFIPGTTYTFNDLESGSSYELYIRTVCSSLDTSLWNGPYFYNTVIDNKTSCGLSLAIEDNSCPGGQPFLIYVDGFADKKMGQDLVIDKLDMVIAHPWPPDLLIQLESPQGNIVDLSRFNGNGTDDYGNSRDSLCMGTASFTDNACISVEDFIPPFTGSFRPETALSNLYTGSSPDGIWKLLICDQASDDIGILKSVKLNFSEEACIIPSGFTIVDIESDNATLIWNQLNNCLNLNLTYKIKGDPVSEAIQDFVECKAGEFTVIDLLPNTSYELIVTAQCSADSNSPESCLIEFQTSCKNYNHLESFDQYGVCDSICNSKCDIPGLWSNDPMNSSDWLLGKGETLTGFTGPDGDINITGNYVYIENQPAFCSSSQDIILVSSCLSYDMSIPCSVSFYYNMYGEETGDLYLEYTTDSIFWSKLWEKSGNQGPGWKFQTVEIPVSFEYGRLRFRALKKENSLRADIAIDHIKLIGPDTVSMKKYFIDADNDGYGNPDIQIFSCTSTPPIGYVENQDDCDDNNSQINPSAIEIECNGIDENCNGLMDDPSVNDIDFVLVNKSNESCNGLSDGTIEIMATNGSEPYNYIWSNGISGSEISGLPAGVYYCTISDFNGCVSVTDSLNIESENVMTYSIPMIAHPSCAGIMDGSVLISVDGGIEPYVVLWDDGIEGIERTDLSDGTYRPTITDSNGCELVMQELVLTGQTALTTSVLIKRDIACKGQQNGLIQLGTQGGSPPYSINWSNGDSSFLITGLQAGAYHATIADAEGCRDEIFDIEITEPDELLIDLRNIEHLTCPDGLDSYIDISVSGGVAPYSYFWSDGSFTEDLNNRPAGSYSITVTDYNACTESLNDIQVNAPQAIQTSLDSINHVNCAGSRNGYLSVSASGGSPPYLYNWSTEDGNFSSDQLLDSLLPGDYALTVVDNFGCKSGTEIFEIINFDKEINIFLDQLDPVLCFSDTTASIIAVGNDGAVPLDFNWSTGEKEIKEIVADTIYNIGAGKYNLTITDNEGCVGISDSIVVIQPEELVFKLDTIVDLLCSGDSTGEISLLIEGGVPPYEVLWNNGMSGLEIKDLHEGYYKASIEDSNGCLLETQELPVHSPDPLEISILLNQANSNQGGRISIVTQGGIAPYMYTWDSPLNFLTDSVAADLDPGEYFFNVVDANGCRIDSMATIDLLDSVSDESQFGSINVFPVPSSNSLTIEYNDLNIKSIEVLNIAGQLILDLIDIPDDRLVLNIENLDTGAYFLIINSQDSRIVRKFLVF